MGGPPHLICVVDDDPSMRRALGRIVRSFGFEVQLLASGRECLDGAHLDRAACLLLDVTMPGMDGFELHTLLQAAGRSVPTVFVSAHDDEGYRQRARSVGAVAFLQKPFGEDLLRHAIDKALGSHEASRS